MLFTAVGEVKVLSQTGCSLLLVNRFEMTAFTSENATPECSPPTPSSHLTVELETQTGANHSRKYICVQLEKPGSLISSVHIIR